MKNIISTLLLLFTFLLPIFGQNKSPNVKKSAKYNNKYTTTTPVRKVVPIFESIDILYLKDGGKLKCRIISETADRLTISLLGNVVTSIRKDLIEKIKPGSPNYYYFTKGYSVKKKGFYATIDRSKYFASSIRTSRYSDVSWHLSLGKMLNSVFAVGIGTGSDIYDGVESRHYTFTPIYAEVRGYHFKKITTPYYSLAVGIGIPNNRSKDFVEQNDYYTTGLFIKPAVGLRIASKRKINYYVELGYRIQNTKSHYEVWTRDFIRGYHWRGIDSTISFRRMQYTVGLLF